MARAIDPSLRRLSPDATRHVTDVLTGVRNEAGIVRAGDRSYVLAILLRGQTDETAAEDAIARAYATILEAVGR